MNLTFATNNPKKSNELKIILEKYGYNVLNLNDLDINTEIIESGKTFHENALIKAQHLHELTGEMSLGEDSGLEVSALSGRPGIYSARYAGQHGNDKANIEKLMSELKNTEDRSARFITVIAVYDGNKVLYFEGEIKGKIADNAVGTGGFGYDPIFIPEGYSKTFAEFSSSEKNEISHRARAVRRLAEFLISTRHLL